MTSTDVPADPPAHTPAQAPVVHVAPQIIVGKAVNKAEHRADKPDQPNVSSACSPDPEFMVRPTKTDGIFFAILVGHCNGVANGVNPLLEHDQLESHFRQFPKFDLALGYYMAYLNLGLVRIVPVRLSEPPPSPVYIASNAPTPARVPPGLFGNPISLPATPAHVNPALLKPVTKPAEPMLKPTLEHPAKPAAKPAVKLATKPSTKPAVFKPAVAKPTPKAGPFSGPSAVAPRPYLLAPPPKPNNSPAPSLTSPTAARELAPDSDVEEPPKKLIFLGTVTVLGSDSESEELAHIPSYPSARPSIQATPAPAIRPFPVPSPLSSEGIPDTPIPVTPPNGKKRMIPLYDDGPFTPSIEGPLQKKSKSAVTSPVAAPASPSVKGSSNRYKIIEAALLKHENTLRTASASPSSTCAQATSSTAALNSPIIASTSTIAPPSITTYTAYRSIGVMSTPSTISTASIATSATGLDMDTDFSGPESSDLEEMLNM